MIMIERTTQKKIVRLWHERRGGSLALARTYQRKPPSKIRARYNVDNVPHKI